MKSKFLRVVAPSVVAALLLAGCGAGSRAANSGEGAGRDTREVGQSAPKEVSEEVTLTVFAAASMEPTFTELAKTFEEEHVGVTVLFNFAGSQTLQEQIIQGAPADVFASANTKQMEPVVEAGLNATEPVIFATNELTIVTPPDNPAGIETFADLAGSGLNLVICAPEVPCGSATVKVQEATGITLSPVSEEQSVTDVLAKVQAGEGDAGLVYKTDAISAGDSVLTIAFPESSEAVNKNPIVALTTGPQAAWGQEWVNFILSPPVAKILQEAGFGSAQ